MKDKSTKTWVVIFRIFNYTLSKCTHSNVEQNLLISKHEQINLKKQSWKYAYSKRFLQYGI